MNIFEKASRSKLRFDSVVGYLTTEQLWDLPLVSSHGPSLDAIARKISKELKETTEESFVDTSPNPRKTELELSLEIIKWVIDAKVQQREASKKAKETADKKRKLMDILANKQDAALSAMTPEEIVAELEKLDAA